MQVIIGIFIGVFIGVGAMCLFQVNRDNDELNYEVKIRKAIDKWKNIKTEEQKEYERNEYENNENMILNKNMIIIAELVAQEIENIL